MNEQVIVSAEDGDERKAKLVAGVDDDEVRARRNTAVEVAGLRASSGGDRRAECAMTGFDIRMELIL